MNPLVSMMIATYNQPDYILQAVESCLNQNYENIEVVVGDDSTTDEVFNALQPLLNNKKLKYFRNAKNLGRVNNYKKLLFDYAQGDWAIMLDGDDYYIDVFFISTAVKWINNNENVVLVAAGHLTIDDKKDEKLVVSLTEQDKIFDGKEIFYQKKKIAQHATNLYNRKLALELDFYRLNAWAADSEGLFRLCLHGNVVYLNNIVVIWRLHDSNNTFNAKLAISQMHELVFIDMVYKYSLKYIDQKAAKEWRINIYTSLSYHIRDLAVKSRNFFTVLRVSLWASKFWGLKATFLFLKTTTNQFFLKNNNS